MVYEIIPKNLGSMSSPIYKTTNRGEMNTSQTSQLILLMVQKSGDYNHRFDVSKTRRK